MSAWSTVLVESRRYTASPALGVLDHPERFQQEPLHLPGERGLPGEEIRDLDPQGGGHHRLVGASLGGEADAGRAGDEDEARLRVRGVQQGVETARQEAVVEGADRQEPTAGQLGGQTQDGQEDEERRLPDPQLEVLAGRGFLPANEGPEPVALEGVVPLAGRIDAAPVDPSGQMRRGSHVGGHGDQRGVEARLAAEGGQNVAERLLRGRRRPRRKVEPVGNGRGRRGTEAPRETDALAHDAPHVAVLGTVGRERGPLVVLRDAEVAPQRGQLVAGELRPVVQRVPGEGQAPPLERPRQDRHRPVGHLVRLRERVDDRVQIVAAQIGEERGDLGVAECLESRDGLRRGALPERLPRGGGREPEKGVVLEVLHGLEPAAQPVAAALGEERREAPAEAKRHHMPAQRPEEALELPAPVVAHDPIEALAVQVDDDHVAGKVGHRLLGPGLPDAPLVQLGVTHERDVPRTARPRAPAPAPRRRPPRSGRGGTGP